MSWRWYVAAALLLACARAADGDVCINTSSGQRTANVRTYKLHLEPQRTTFDFKIPDPPGCIKTGASLSSCESRASSSLQLRGQARALVQRSATADPGQIDLVVYCA